MNIADCAFSSPPLQRPFAAASREAQADDPKLRSQRSLGSYRLVWVQLSGVADQWSILFQLLPTLNAQHVALGTNSGTLRIARGSSDEPTFEEWPIHVDTHTRDLRTRVEACGEIPRPLELPLSCEPLLWLPDDHVKVLDYDDVISDGPDLWSPGCATISKVASELFSVPVGLQLWRLHHAPVPLLSLVVTFSSGTDMSLWVRSNCDLWRPMRLDGEPNTPHGEVNASLLASSLAEVAAATGARLET